METITEYKCRRCEHRFPKSNKEDKYCPACDCENTVPIRQGKKNV